MQAKPQTEHGWLQKMVGEWTGEFECIMGPDQPPTVHTARDVVRSLGGVWVVCEGDSEMPGGGSMQSIMTLGYDPLKRQFLGTFIASCMTHMWLYENGSLDATGTILTLNADGPSFTDPTKMAKYQDIIEFKSDDHRTLSSQFLGDDGQWNRFMTGHYRRQK